MSSEDNFLASLILVQTNLYRFIGLILIGVGTASCILGMMIFTRKNLRKNPRSINLMAHNVCNFLLIYTSALFSILSSGYIIDLSAYNLGFCHFRFYTLLLFEMLSPCYLILASIDLIFLTSRNALTRQRSTLRRAYISIIIMTMFWSLCHIHALVLTTIIQVRPHFILCYFQPGIYTMLINYYSAIIKGILIPLLMIILGLWTIKNIRGVSHVAPVSIVVATETITVRNVPVGHSKDRQLLQILLVDISIYVTFNLMSSITILYQQFALNNSQSITAPQIQARLINIGLFSSYIPFCTGCCTNLLVSKIFRHEVKNVLMCK